MKKALLVVLVGVFVLGMASTALAVTPTVIGANGASSFTYQDLKDAGAKYSGGYATFDNTVTAMYANPHGGYSSTSNKCKVCHAVHRAEGAYYLLRADNQADACDYCHIGGSAHSNKVVYDLNPAGTDTTNGHTMGAGMVPDSSTKQTAQAVTISGTTMSGETTSEVVNVRSYDSSLIQLFRFSRHHSQSPVSTGRSGWKPVGPNALSCFSCHQPHNALAQVWQPSKYDTALLADTPGGNNTTGYKLLRRYPSGSWLKWDGAANGTTTTAAPLMTSATTQTTVNVTNKYTDAGVTEYVDNGENIYGMVDSTLAIKVPETTLTAGYNYSQNVSSEKFYTENGVTVAQPTWIAQNISAEYGGSGVSEDPATVNQYTLSVWCADCHNLNIGGSEALTKEELGFKAHTERTHPAPYVGAHAGPGQCYSCHRDDLSVAGNVADPAGYGSGQSAVNIGANQNCQQCHYGTQQYQADRAARNSDFPHSGKASDMKLLGSYTARVATSAKYDSTGTDFAFTTITAGNLDAVCIRCHPGIGVHN